MTFCLAQAQELLEASKSAGFIGVLLVTLLLCQGGFILAVWKWFRPLAENWLSTQIKCTSDVSIAIKKMTETSTQESEARKKDSESHRIIADAYSNLSSLVCMLAQRLGMHESSMVLVIEDSMMDAHLILAKMRGVAKKYGMDILHVMTLREARLHTWESCLVILDVGLPDVLDPEYDISEFVNRCKCPVILYTGRNDFVCKQAESVIVKGNIQGLMDKTEEVLRRGKQDFC